MTTFRLYRRWRGLMDAAVTVTVLLAVVGAYCVTQQRDEAGARGDVHASR